MNLPREGAPRGRHAPRHSPRDHETRERLLHKAAPLFAERGFKRATIRALCEATGANVAAVNYYFGSKLGLYREVVRTAIAAMRETNGIAIRAGEGRPPDERLRAFIRVYLERVVGHWDTSWIHKLVAREMADPTPALEMVITEAFRPRMDYLCLTVSELMGRPAEDELVRHCAASIFSQWLVYAPGKLRRHMVPAWQATEAQVDRLARDMADFSLAGIRGLARDRGSAD